MSKKFLCIHGHFYQPPRENPWLDEIEIQESAHPYHDWNERIFWECYAPNGSSRILDEQGFIKRIVNNYESISFNFGPTLLWWLKAKHPALIDVLKAADLKSRDRLGGHGNAMAQVYNHIIMPLADPVHKKLQVLWGIEVFKNIFGRNPEGMWLAETAADIETLKVLHDHGIKFTILSPYQAFRIRPIEADENSWEDVSGARLDPTRPYRAFLDRNKSAYIDIIFYDAPISQAVSFEGLLKDGEYLAARLKNGFSDSREHDQLLTVATDGESYGHHTIFGDMALSYALDRISREDDIELTNPAAFLESHPPEWEVEIFSPSSWSCPHGVERWRSDCGCSTGNPGWHQRWRAPLRKALENLLSKLNKHFEKEAPRLLSDPNGALERYIQVLLDDGERSRIEFIDREKASPLTDVEISKALKLLEMQRHGMLMFTSCAWFFDEISRPESVQVMRYAARAAQLCRETGGDDPENDLIKDLESAESNVPEFKNGAEIYRRFVLPSKVGVGRLVAHRAIASFFEADDDTPSAYTMESIDESEAEHGALTLKTALLNVKFTYTLQSVKAAHATLRVDPNDFHCAVRAVADDTEYEAMKRSVLKAFSEGGVTETIRAMDADFSPSYFTLKDLFLDRKSSILRRLADEQIAKHKERLKEIYEGLIPLMSELKEHGMRLPAGFMSVCNWLLTEDLVEGVKKLLNKGEEGSLSEAVKQAKIWDVDTQNPSLKYDIEKELLSAVEKIRSLSDTYDMNRITAVLAFMNELGMDLNLWRAQNYMYNFLMRTFEKGKDPSDLPELQRLCSLLKINIAAVKSSAHG